jgi:hypothetical protein
MAKGCAGDAQQKRKTTDPTSRQRGCPKSTNPQLYKKNIKEKRGKFGRGSQMGAQHQDRLAVDRNITLTFKIAPSVNKIKIQIITAK